MDEDTVLDWLARQYRLFISDPDDERELHIALTSDNLEMIQELSLCAGGNVFTKYATIDWEVRGDEAISLLKKIDKRLTNKYKRMLVRHWISIYGQNH